MKINQDQFFTKASVSTCLTICKHSCIESINDRVHPVLDQVIKHLRLAGMTIEHQIKVEDLSIHHHLSVVNVQDILLSLPRWSDPHAHQDIALGAYGVVSSGGLKHRHIGWCSRGQYRLISTMEILLLQLLFLLLCNGVRQYGSRLVARLEELGRLLRLTAVIFVFSRSWIKFNIDQIILF